MANKTLILARHGKSAWDYDNRDDIDRPLNNRGVEDACFMGNVLKKKPVIPERIITSSAERAVHTALIYARVLEVQDSQISIDSDLYLTEEESLFLYVKNLEDSFSSVMIVGHNPTFTIFANTFLKKPIDNLPTSGVAIIEFNTDKWEQANPDNVKAVSVDYPKKHKK